MPLAVSPELGGAAHHRNDSAILRHDEREAGKALGESGRDHAQLLQVPAPLPGKAPGPKAAAKIDVSIEMAEQSIDEDIGFAALVLPLPGVASILE